jgi:8-oxo-dGTP diphosphatase
MRFWQKVQAVSRQTDLILQVAAGILRNAAGEILITERIENGPFQGLWEFPGGKIAADETAQMALCRELREELGIDVLAQEHFQSITHTYADRTVELDFFFVNQWRGEPAGQEGQRLRWVDVARLDAAELLPADAPLIDALREST